MKHLEIFDKSLIDAFKNQLKRNISFFKAKFGDLDIKLTSYQEDVLRYLYEMDNWRSYYEINIFLFGSNGKRKMGKYSCEVLEKCLLVDSMVVENGLVEYRINDFGKLYIEDKNRALQEIRDFDIEEEARKQIKNILNEIELEIS